MITLKVGQTKDARRAGELLYACNQELNKDGSCSFNKINATLEDCVQHFQKTMCMDVITGWYGDEMVGICTYGPARGENFLKDAGEIYTLYIEPEYQRNGDGRRMVHEAIRKLRREEYNGVVVWIGETNIAALAFYDALGFRNDGTYRYANGESDIREILFFRSI